VGHTNTLILVCIRQTGRSPHIVDAVESVRVICTPPPSVPTTLKVFAPIRASSFFCGNSGAPENSDTDELWSNDCREEKELVPSFVDLPADEPLYWKEIFELESIADASENRCSVLGLMRSFPTKALR